MRLVCFSDTHNYHDSVKLPDGDVLIFAGDFSSRGTIPQAASFDNWLGKQTHPHKLVVAGNHDWCMFRKEYVFQNCTYLEDSGIVIDGVSFYGSPWTPFFHKWAFNFDETNYEAQALATWATIPENTDVLITHGPAWDVLDEVAPYYTDDLPLRVGCPYLRNRIINLPQIKFHIFGHIHEAYGVEVIGSRTHINASVCDRHYRPVNLPVVVDL